MSLGLRGEKEELKELKVFKTKTENILFRKCDLILLPSPQFWFWSISLFTILETLISTSEKPALKGIAIRRRKEIIQQNVQKDSISAMYWKLVTTLLSSWNELFTEEYSAC